MDTPRAVSGELGSRVGLLDIFKSCLYNFVPIGSVAFLAWAEACVLVGWIQEAPVFTHSIAGAWVWLDA